MRCAIRMRTGSICDVYSKRKQTNEAETDISVTETELSIAIYDAHRLISTKPDVGNAAVLQ